MQYIHIKITSITINLSKFHTNLITAKLRNTYKRFNNHFYLNPAVNA